MLTATTEEDHSHVGRTSCALLPFPQVSSAVRAKPFPAAGHRQTGATGLRPDRGHPGRRPGTTPASPANPPSADVAAAQTSVRTVTERFPGYRGGPGIAALRRTHNRGVEGPRFPELAVAHPGHLERTSMNAFALN